MWQKILEALTKLGVKVEIPDDKKAEVEAALKEIKPDPPAKETATVTPESVQQMIAQAIEKLGIQKPETKSASSSALSQDQIDAIKQVVVEVTKPLVEQREAEKKVVDALNKATQERKVTELLDDAVAKGRITPKDRDTWKKDLEEAASESDKAFDRMQAALTRIPENPTLAKASAAEGAKKDGKAVVGTQASGAQSQQTTGKYETGFARGANPAIMKHVEEQLS